MSKDTVKRIMMLGIVVWCFMLGGMAFMLTRKMVSVPVALISALVYTVVYVVGYVWLEKTGRM